MPSTATPALGATVLGYPRIGPRRELKRALEAHWRANRPGRAASGSADATDTRARLLATAADLRASSWQRLSALGLDSIPCNDFTYYDHMLDTAVLVGAVPARFAGIDDDLDRYFAMARGTSELAPLEMTKWFDTNYHYLVPEIGADTTFVLDPAKPLAELAQARALGINARPVLVGPLTFLLLAKHDSASSAGYHPFDRLDDLLPVYAQLLSRLRAAGADWVQLDESAFVADRTPTELAALRSTYDRLAALSDRPALLVTASYGPLGPALRELAATGVDGIGLDFVAGPAPTAPADLAGVPGLADKTLLAGVIDGHNVWRADLDDRLALLGTLLGLAGTVEVGSSCSLLHVPYSLTPETRLPADVASWLAFADEKVAEIALLAKALRGGADTDEPDAAVAAGLAEARAARASRLASPKVRRDRVRGRLNGLRPEHIHRGPAQQRHQAQRQRLQLPNLPTTTIGSFPQTGEIRRARADFTKGRIDADTYSARMRAEVENVIRLQERLGLDVLVHGEPERNDMVQYFAEQLDGFAVTDNGWVQSYGSRCVRPPILFGDVERPHDMTVEWATYAQSLTDRPVKGMLTGPVTILAWSFVRDDEPIGDVANQVALAIRDEVHALESAGLAIVQVDEPALRELLPLRAADQKAYLDWAVGSFRLATSGVADTTSIHTHLCYSEFGEVVDAIDGLDADVTSIEAARSRMEILPDLAASGFSRGIGPGVYDIHSPRVPDEAEITGLIEAAAKVVATDRLWINPDCGLKTRTYAEVEPALANLVQAAKAVRAQSQQ